MELILAGEATPAQIGGFLLVGRAGRNFDGKLRTFNVGAAASLVAAAAGGRTLLLGNENTPPKAGRTVFDALRGLGVSAPQTLSEAEASLAERGFAATSVEHYLPEFHALLPLRWEMARRTVLSVCEKMVSPAPDSPMMVGVSHKSFLMTISRALMNLGVEHALVYQAIEGSDEAPLDGSSALIRVRDGELKEFTVIPESLGLTRATKAHIPWKGPDSEKESLLAVLGGGGAEPVRALILYNAALRLWMEDPELPLNAHLERASGALDTGEAVRILGSFRRAVTIAG